MVVIRLSRGGAKARPFFNIVVADKRIRRDGRFIERLGFYNPIAKDNEESIRIAQDRLTYWRGVGAQASPTVERLIKQAAARQRRPQRAEPPERARPSGSHAARGPRSRRTARGRRSKSGASPMPGASRAGSRSCPTAPRPRRFFLPSAGSCSRRARRQDLRRHGAAARPRSQGAFRHHRRLRPGGGRPQRGRGAARRAHLRAALQLSHRRRPTSTTGST